MSSSPERTTMPDESLQPSPPKAVAGPSNRSPDGATAGRSNSSPSGDACDGLQSNYDEIVVVQGHSLPRRPSEQELLNEIRERIDIDDMLREQNTVRLTDEDILTSPINNIRVVPLQKNPFPVKPDPLIVTKYFNDSKKRDLKPEELNQITPTSEIAKKDLCKWKGFAPRGLPEAIDATYESFDYSENSSFVRSVKDSGKGRFVWGEMWRNFRRFSIVPVIGILTALVAVAIDQSIEYLAEIKYELISKLMNMAYTLQLSFWSVYGFATAWNLAFVFMAALCVYVSPIAQGSGIPQVKCFLNGVKIPHLTRFKTLLCRTSGVVFSVVGGLPVGKEGPMIHSGAALGAGISQGASTTIFGGFKTNLFKDFRNDQEKRDFVACGAAAGVAAAFGSPMGGLLFAIEEGASHVSLSVLWRVALASGFSFGTLSLMKSIILDVPGQFSNGGLISFGRFDDAEYNFYQLIVYLLMGFFGAISGAFFNYFNAFLTRLRMRCMHAHRFYKVLEVLLCGFVVTTVAFLFVIQDRTCEDENYVPSISNNYTAFEMNCPNGDVNSAADLWYKIPESLIKSLFHDEINTHSLHTLAIFTCVYWLLSCWTYGMGISNGLFVPSLLIGAGWGRCVGILLSRFFPGVAWGDVGKYSLIGASAQLAGTVRLTYSLTCIVIEAIGNLTYIFPILATVIISKHFGDWFNKGIYDIHIDLAGIPMMEPEASIKARFIQVGHIMATPVRVLPIQVTVKDIIHILRTTTHNAFPVVDTVPKIDKEMPTFGRLRGLMTRDFINTMIANNLFSNAPDFGFPKHGADFNVLREPYPRYPNEDQAVAHLSEDLQAKLLLDFSLHMERAPITVSRLMTYTKAHDIFRNVGCRHMVAIDDDNEVMGMITRKDLVQLEAVVTVKLGSVFKRKPVFYPAFKSVVGYAGLFAHFIGLKIAPGSFDYSRQVNEEDDDAIEETDGENNDQEEPPEEAATNEDAKDKNE